MTGLTWLRLRLQVRARVRVRDDQGSATVWVVGLIGTLCLIAAGLLLAAQAVLARHKAGGAADLAALAAADHALRGEKTACAQATRVARAQATDLVRCAVRGEIADVTVRAESGPMSSSVRARAGPPGPIESLRSLRPEGSLRNARRAGPPGPIEPPPPEGPHRPEGPPRQEGPPRNGRQAET